MCRVVARKLRFTQVVNQNCLAVPKGLGSYRHRSSPFLLIEFQIAKFLTVQGLAEQCPTVHKRAVVFSERDCYDTLQLQCVLQEILFLVNFAADFSRVFYYDLIMAGHNFTIQVTFYFLRKYRNVLPDPFVELKRKKFLNEGIIMSSNMFGMCD